MSEVGFNPVVAGVPLSHDRPAEEYTFDALEEARDGGHHHHRRHEPRAKHPALHKDAPAAPAPVSHPDDGIRGTKLDVLA